MSSSAFNFDELPKDELIQDLLANIDPASWYGEMSGESSERLLQGKKVGTYLFRLDPLGTVFLSGINVDGSVEHSIILKNDSMWLGIDAEPYLRDSVNTLIHLCLHCKEEECVPLR